MENRPAGDGEVVLVIDDEPTIRMLISEVLEEHDYAVLEASDGPSGMRILQSAARIDLLITDVGLPNGMNGRQIADAARQTRPGLKVLFITGYAENAVVGNGQCEVGVGQGYRSVGVDYSIGGICQAGFGFFRQRAQRTDHIRRLPGAYNGVQRGRSDPAITISKQTKRPDVCPARGSYSGTGATPFSTSVAAFLSQ
jgi:CheY-like chemotaxis protein